MKIDKILVSTKITERRLRLDVNDIECIGEKITLNKTYSEIKKIEAV